MQNLHRNNIRYEQQIIYYANYYNYFVLNTKTTVYLTFCNTIRYIMTSILNRTLQNSPTYSLLYK
jgi:hypothetical protein